MEVEQDAPESARSSPAADRITVALIQKAADDLHAVTSRTGLSKTDVVNRAVTLYQFIDAELAAGNELQVRDPETGTIQILRLL